MMKSMILVLLAATACGAPIEPELENGQEHKHGLSINSDDPIWVCPHATEEEVEMALQAREEGLPEAESEIGTIEQPFVAAKYYGGGEAVPCYAPNNNDICFFPNSKRMRYYWDPSVSGRTGAGFRRALDTWKRATTELTVTGWAYSEMPSAARADTQFYMLFDPSRGDLGFNEATATNHFEMPGGKTGALTFRNIVKLMPQNIENFMNRCSNGLSYELMGFQVAMHELGHVHGFAHFSTGFMTAILDCQNALNRVPFIPKTFTDAMTIYDWRDRSGITIVNLGLTL